MRPGPEGSGSARSGREDRRIGARRRPRRAVEQLPCSGRPIRHTRQPRRSPPTRPRRQRRVSRNRSNGFADGRSDHRRAGKCHEALQRACSAPATAPPTGSMPSLRTKSTPIQPETAHGNDWKPRTSTTAQPLRSTTRRANTAATVSNQRPHARGNGMPSRSNQARVQIGSHAHGQSAHTAKHSPGHPMAVSETWCEYTAAPSRVRQQEPNVTSDGERV